MVRFVLANAKKVDHLELYFEDRNIKVLNRILDEIIESGKLCQLKANIIDHFPDHVHLKTLHVKRRQAGQTVSKIGDVIRANAASLREISRVGISEASHGFNDQVRPKCSKSHSLCFFQINLDRFGCMTFDLGFQPLPNQIPLHMIRMSESGAKFKSLSYTSFSGFDPTDQIVHNFLENSQVETIKLTMMNPPNIPSRPGYMIGKVRNGSENRKKQIFFQIRSVKRVELVEIVPEPQRINKLVCCRHVFEKVFPNCHENLFFLQQWE